MYILCNYLTSRKLKEVYVSWKFVGIKWKFDSTNIIIKLCKKKADRPIDLYSLWAIDSLSHYHYFLLKYLLARMFFSNNNLLPTLNSLIYEHACYFFFKRNKWKNFPHTQLYLSELAFNNQFYFQCCWTRMASQMIECYQFRCHFTEPQKRYRTRIGLCF